MADSLYISGNKIKLGQDEITFPGSSSLTITGNTLKSNTNDSISLPNSFLNLNGSGIKNKDLTVFPNKNLIKENGVTISKDITGFLRGPSKPILNNVSQNSGYVSLYWSTTDENSSISFFRIYVYDPNGDRVTDPSTGYKNSYDSTANTYSLKDIDQLRNASGEYTFRVSTVDTSQVESDLSDPFKFVMKPVPYPPTLNSVTVTGLHSVSLSWSIDPRDNVDSITGFNVYVYNPNGDYIDNITQYSVQGTSTNITIPSELYMPGSYIFEVSALNNEGEGMTSDVVESGSPSPPVINFNPPNNPKYRLSDQRATFYWSDPLLMFDSPSNVQYKVNVYNSDGTVYFSSSFTTTKNKVNFLAQGMNDQGRYIGIIPKNTFGLGIEALLFIGDFTVSQF